MTVEPPAISTPSIRRLAGNIGFLAARFSWFAARPANAALTPFDLRTRQYSGLEPAGVGSGTTQRDIVRALRLDSSAVVGLVDGLAAAGGCGCDAAPRADTSDAATPR
ncbi:hypothetical protein GCM10022240_16470 [Microbacterium kribbense]|uniref:MarR family transcriptional regulator n=1 Tax=Microbacterium kribbense TaxID=433645 RepID=A0ABP7GGL5_9MICO